jgi:ligand-binding SRPBCC domain-containing protein
MTTYELRRETFLRAPLEEVFEFFSEARNLERITPPFLGFHVLTPEPIPMHAGTIIDYKLKIRGVPARWRTLIETWNPPFEFSDTQERGPYRLWHHTHRFRAVDGGTSMVDIIRYALPFGPLGRLVHRLQVRRDVEAIFEFREQRIQELFGAKRKRPSTVG